MNKYEFGSISKNKNEKQRNKNKINRFDNLFSDDHVASK